MVLTSGPAHPPHGGHSGEQSAPGFRFKPAGSGGAEAYLPLRSSRGVDIVLQPAMTCRGRTVGSELEDTTS